MTREKFLEAIQEAKINPSAFDLDGQGVECFVLSDDGAYWSVYYRERGLERNKHYFGSEAALWRAQR